jgi:hypothetical protein
MLMLSLQWWGFEVGTLLSGVLGEVQLAAQSVLFQIETIVFMVSSLPTDVVRCHNPTTWLNLLIII